MQGHIHGLAPEVLLGGDSFAATCGDASVGATTDAIAGCALQTAAMANNDAATKKPSPRPFLSP
ncbi:MAG TPA: hypothetical protein DCQ04_04975 [Actinobacteria bacterium]|nr:hypothetical protein [Actinomycetota bacterium]